MQLIQGARENILSLLEQCNTVYEVAPFDEELYQECVDDAAQRGYPVDGDLSVQTHLRVGVYYAATAAMHHQRPTQIWIALYTSCAALIDEACGRFPEEVPNIYLFKDRLIRGEPQGNDVLEAFADIIRRTSDVHRPIASHLVTTSTLNFVTATLLEHETRSMKISSAAQLYPNYLRILSGFGEAFGFMIFPREIPLNDYIQAIPEITLFLHNTNDVISFYKEEKAGETTNQITTLAARTEKSKMETLGELMRTTVDIYKRILNILEEFPEAYEVFKHFTTAYLRFHTSTERYELEDLHL